MTAVRRPEIFIRRFPAPSQVENPPNLVVALIQSHLGNTQAARESLIRQLHEPARNPGHRQYVKDLALKLGLGEIAK